MEKSVIVSTSLLPMKNKSLLPLERLLMKGVALLECCPGKLDFHLQLLLQVLHGTPENFSSKCFYPTYACQIPITFIY